MACSRSARVVIFSGSTALILYGSATGRPIDSSFREARSWREHGPVWRRTKSCDGRHGRGMERRPYSRHMPTVIDELPVLDSVTAVFRAIGRTILFLDRDFRVLRDGASPVAGFPPD